MARIFVGAQSSKTNIATKLENGSLEPVWSRGPFLPLSLIDILEGNEWNIEEEEEVWALPQMLCVHAYSMQLGTSLSGNEVLMNPSMRVFWLGLSLSLTLV